MIVLDGVGKLYDGRHVVRGVSLDIAEGECLVLVGGSGSGKSTTLRMINRLIEADEGRISVEGRDVRDGDPVALRRRIGYVIQSTGLFPHWSVARNIAAVPVLLGWDRARIAARVDELLVLLGLDPGTYRDRRPRALSGGEAQRVGIARALASDPPILLMDEPFSALDPITRAGLQTEIVRLRAATGKTIVFVSHDIDEALAIATRIGVMRRGALVQVATPASLLASPADAQIRAFLGGDRIAEKLLGVVRVRDRARSGPAATGTPEIEAEATLRAALGRMVETGSDVLAVRGAEGGAQHLAIGDVLGA